MCDELVKNQKKKKKSCEFLFVDLMKLGVYVEINK